jgi:hypothetical protein
MRLVVTIDTESDRWGPAPGRPEGVRNIEALPDLQELFTRFEVRPTYLVDHPVATFPASVRILRGLLQSGECEIGAHCHPWSTPPVVEAAGRANSMLCNLPTELQERKLQALHAAVAGSFGIPPTTFRTGRWGYSGSVAQALHRIGYRVDTSLTPHVDWRPQHGQDFTEAGLRPYYFDPKRFLAADPGGPMLEVPATIAQLGPVGRLSRLTEFGSRGRTLQRRLIRLLSRARLLRRVWLSPETTCARDLIAITQGLRRAGAPLANLFFHSSALLPGLTPTIRTAADKARFMADLRSYLEFTARAGIRSILLSEVPALIPRAGGTRPESAGSLPRAELALP